MTQQNIWLTYLNTTDITQMVLMKISSCMAKSWYFAIFRQYFVWNQFEWFYSSIFVYTNEFYGNWFSLGLINYILVHRSYTMRYTKTAIVYRIMELMKIIIKIFRSLSIETKIQTRDPITLKEIQNCVDFAPDGLSNTCIHQLV